MRRLSSLSSEALRWFIGLVGLITGGIGVSLLWGIGWGLAIVGLGVTVIVLLYDPDRARGAP